MQVNPLFADVSSTLLLWSGFKRNLKQVALFLFRHLAAASVHALHMSRIEALPQARVREDAKPERQPWLHAARRPRRDPAWTPILGPR